MYDPISVETALVSAGGDLLIQLSDGNIINAGRVRGMPGPQGEKGEQGIRGAHGKDGIDGTNGAKWHTGVGAPEIGLGVDGDLYMDVASALLPIYQKVNGDWLFLANLKVSPAGGGGGGGTAAGGGGSVIIYPGPQPPIVDNDGKPIQDGDLWVDINGNILYVYYNGVWSEVTTCSAGGGSNGDFLKRYGDRIEDAENGVSYSWNKGLQLFSGEDINIEGTREIKINSAYANILIDANTDISLEAFGTIAVRGQTEVLLNAINGKETVRRIINDTSDLKQITNKEYVDGLFDFSAYPPLP